MSKLTASVIGGVLFVLVNIYPIIKTQGILSIKIASTMLMFGIGMIVVLASNWLDSKIFKKKEIKE